MSAPALLVRAERVHKRLRPPLLLRRRARVFELKEMSFDVDRGEAVALLGHNGAGKSTLLALLGGIYRPTSGSLWIRGATSPVIGFASPFSFNLTPREHLRTARAAMGRALDVDRALEVAGLSGHADEPVRRLSAGQRTRLGLVAGLLAPADLYLIDEGLAVCDSAFRGWAFEHLRRRREEGSAVVVAGHDLLAARALCQRGMVLSGGRLVLDGGIDSALAALAAPGAASPEAPGATASPEGVVVETVAAEVEEQYGRPVIVVRCRLRGARSPFQLTVAVRNTLGQVLHASRTVISADVPGCSEADLANPEVILPARYVPDGSYTLYVTVSNSEGVPQATREHAAVLEIGAYATDGQRLAAFGQCP